MNTKQKKLTKSSCKNYFWRVGMVWREKIVLVVIKRNVTEGSRKTDESVVLHIFPCKTLFVYPSHLIYSLGFVLYFIHISFIVIMNKHHLRQRRGGCLAFFCLVTYKSNKLGSWFRKKINL